MLSYFHTLLLLSSVSAECQNILGNWYCNQVQQIRYALTGESGSYNRVTNMGADGSCSSEPFNYAGGLGPFDEELSVHFRGPIKLNEFAVYTPGAFDNEPEAPAPEHHMHKRGAKVVVTSYTTAFITLDQFGNQVVPTVLPDPHGAGDLTTSPANPDETTKSTPTEVTPVVSSVVTSSVVPSPKPPPKPLAGSFVRDSYYNAKSQVAANVTFMNNLGGSLSGVFDYNFGNSLSYCSANGVESAASAQVLDSVLIPSNKEFSIFGGTKCEGDSCGYYRPGIPAYHGFGGAQKIFLFDFEMPLDTPGEGFNYDMPAVWLLNAQIPRTLQYGKIECSCWATGCGEFDLFEVLNSGNDRVITAMHLSKGKGQGSPYFFPRPTQGSLRAAAIFDGDSVTVTILPKDAEFSASLAKDTLNQWISAGASSRVLAN